MIPTISRLTKPAYPGHWPVGKLENLFLAAGSAVVSLVDVYRHGEFIYVLYLNI